MANLSDEKSHFIHAMCAAGWFVFALIIKNIVLLVILAAQRRRHSAYKVPEDVTTFGAGQQQSGSFDDWSMAGRIQRVLANDTEYVPYFFVLFIMLFAVAGFMGYSNNNFLVRTVVYGGLFVVARYMHTLSYLFISTYGRILGFLVSVIILLAMAIDNVYYFTKIATLN